MQIVTLPLLGLSQGAQPIISYNFGAKNIKRVKRAFKLLLTSCLVYTIAMWAALMIFPEFFVGIFNKKPELVEITSWSMRIYFAGILIFGAQIACQQTFLALGKAKVSLIMALLRKIVLLVPLIFILPSLVSVENKLGAVLFAEPISDIVASLITVIVFTIFYRRTFIKNVEGNGNLL